MTIVTFRNGKYWRNSKFGEKINHWPNEDSLCLKKKVKENSYFSDFVMNGALDKKETRIKEKRQDGSYLGLKEGYLVGRDIRKAALN